MAIADTNKVAISMNEESAWGETPTAVAMQQTRYTGESLSYAKQTVVSETIRDDRMRDQVALVGFNTEGDLEFEFAAFDFDPLLEGALFGTWGGIFTKTATTIAATGTGFSDSGNGFANVAVGSYIYVSGFATKSLNRRYRVTASAAGSITTNPAPATTAVAGPSVTVSSTGMSILTATTTLIATVTTNAVTFSGSTGFNPLTGMNLQVGQFIRFSGFANAGNNGIKRIAAISSTAITTVDTLVAETVTAATTLSFTARTLRNGVTSRSYHIQKAFTDIAQFMSFRGMRVGGASLSLAAGEIVTGSFNMMGKTVARAAVTYATSSIATNTSPVMTASAHVGNINQNGVAIAAGLRSISVEIENNLRTQAQIGSLSPYGIGSGFMDITGSIEAYFEDATLYDQLINHTATELSWRITDDLGNTYVITLPQVLFTEGYPMAGGGNDDVMMPLSYQAIRSSTYNCQIQIDLLPSLV